MVILSELIILLSVSAVVLYISTRLNLPSVVGLLLAGIVVGPYGAALINSEAEVQEMAEIGILLLLFSIGIEFSLDKLLQSRKFVLLGGSLQVGITLLVAAIAAYGFGLSWGESIFIGMLISMSSTAIVLQLFQDKGWTNTPFGRNAISILIFQDIIIIPMMLLVPYLGEGASQTQSSLYQLGIGIIIIIATVFAARKLVPMILRQIVHSRNQDLFLITIIVICFATAFITYELGLKLALGAFLAGLVISESEYSFEALRNIKPFKKIFTALFFISVGMLLNIYFVGQNLLLVVGLTLAAIMVKAVIVTGISYGLGLGLQNALVSGLALAQVGEFAFILSKVGIDIALISDSTYQLFLSISIMSMILTAIIIGKAPKWAGIMANREPLVRLFPKSATSACLPAPCSLQNHVVIVGFGPGGKRIAESLLEKEEKIAVIDTNDRNFTPEFNDRMESFVGDATDRDILVRAGMMAARQVIITVPEAAVAENITRKARQLNMHANIIVRSKYASEVEELEKLGADLVIPEELTVADMINRSLLPGSN